MKNYLYLIIVYPISILTFRILLEDTYSEGGSSRTIEGLFKQDLKEEDLLGKFTERRPAFIFPSTSEKLPDL